MSIFPPASETRRESHTIGAMASRAFTLLETVIVIAFSIIIFLVITNFYLNFNSVLGSDGALMGVTADAGRIMNELETTVLPADHVLASYTFSAGTYTSNQTTLVLELPSVDSSGNQITGKYDYVAFYANGATVYRLTQADPASSRISGTKQLATTLSGSKFTYDNADFTQVKKVDIDIQTSVVVKGRTNTGHLHEQLSLRNH